MRIKGYEPPEPGHRVRLVHCTDEYTRLRPGALGTITHIDSLGTIRVRWDDGSSLGMVEEAGDVIERVYE